MDELKHQLSNSSSSKITTYKSLNPTLTSHPVYDNKYTGIQEFMRFEFTKFRLSSHNLRIEKDRWLRPMPPREMRGCSCSNEVQDEAHVIQTCNLTQGIRQRYTGINYNISEFFTENNSDTQICIIYEIKKMFD